MKSLSYLNKYFIKYKWRLLAGVLFICASNYFYVKMPLFLKSTLDEFETGAVDLNLLGFDFTISTSEPLTAAWSIGFVYMCLIGMKGIFLFFTRQTIIKVSRFIEYDLKNEIYQQYQKLDYSFYKKNSTGDLMNRISEDVSHVRMYLGPGVMYTINLVALFAFVIYEMLFINSWMTFVVLLPLPIMSFIIYKVSNKINRISGNVQSEQSTMSTIVQESFSGIRVIKAYNRENETYEQFENSANTYKNRMMRLVMVNSLFMPTILLLIGLSTLLSIYVGGLMSYSGVISIGGITAFIFYVNNLTWPFASVGWVTSLIQRAAASQERINAFLKVKPEIKVTNKAHFDFQGKIEFRNVSYTYPSGIKAIDNLSFTIEPGEVIAFVGRTGCGKSTLLKLILRQIDSQEGEILIDGHNLKDINLRDFRKQTGIVPQDVFLFSDTISNNIKFGSNNPNVSQEEVVNVAKTAHVHHNIIEFKNGYETLLGERGVNLSGGQKQRISIARALIRQPKMLLFDDCLSAVDTETEEKILANLRHQTQEKTAVLVSHRISSLRNADKVIVLENGAKIEEGSHEELLSKTGIYSEMYHKQLAEENT